MSYTLDILNCTGEVVGKYDIPEGVIDLENGKQAVHDAVVAFLAGNRAGTACTKTRGLVRGGGAKPWRQKGRGGARAGSSRSPVWVGGGTIFGPQPRSFAKKVNKKVLALALKRAISERIAEGSVVVIDAFNLADHKTKSAVAVFKNINVYNENTFLLTVPEFDEAAVCATGNIQHMVMRRAACVNVYELLRCNKLVFTREALDQFITRLA